MELPTDTRAINSLIADATYIAERSKHPLAWHAVQQLEQLRNTLHTAAEREGARAAVNAHDTLNEVFHALRGDLRLTDALHALDAGLRAALAARGIEYNA